MPISIDINFHLELSHPNTKDLIELRDYQKRVLDDFNTKRILWWGRRTGKTITSSLVALNYALSPGDWPREDFSRILIFAAQKIHIESMFSNLRGILQNSGLGSLIQIGQRDGRQKITISYPGGMVCSIIGIPLSSRGLAPCGLDGDLIILDEADYISEECIDVIEPILFDKPNVKLLISGTPRFDKNSFMHRVAGSSEISLHRVTVLDVPESNSFIAQLKKDLSPKAFETECMVPL